MTKLGAQLSRVVLFWCLVSAGLFLTGNSISRGQVPAPAAPPPTGHVADVLQPFVDEHDIAGAVVLVADKHGVLDVGAVGYADLETRKPMDPNAMFWIASMSKAMTAAAIMMLVDEGKVQLDAPVEKYLPEFRGQMVLDPKDKTHTPQKPVHPIAVREILSHTSGLPFKSDLEKSQKGPLDHYPLSVAVASYAKTPLLFQPGTDFYYANAGFNTAGRIIEVVSGMPYEDFMQQRLLGPLGMKDTTFWPDDEQVSRLATSYQENAAKNGLEPLRITSLTYPLTNHANRFPMPAGGLFSTASDVARFCQMILNRGVGGDGKRLLSAAAIKEMTKRQTPPNVKTPYAFGFDVGLDHIVHNGAYNTSMRIDPKLGFVAVLMLQYAGNWPGNVGNKITGAYMNAATTFVRAKMQAAAGAPL